VGVEQGDALSHQDGTQQPHVAGDCGQGALGVEGAPRNVVNLWPGGAAAAFKAMVVVAKPAYNGCGSNVRGIVKGTCGRDRGGAGDWSAACRVGEG
jgi:hypothetical protein